MEGASTPTVPGAWSRSRGLRGCAQAGATEAEPAAAQVTATSLLWVPAPGAARSCVSFQLLFSKFTEQLEDFHVWASVHSRPAGRGLLHTPRLSVAFALLCAYACLAALVTAAGHGQVGHFP